MRIGRVQVDGVLPGVPSVNGDPRLKGVRRWYGGNGVKDRREGLQMLAPAAGGRTVDRHEKPQLAHIRVVRRGDSLASIAAQVYDDPSAWRAIARANGIENPLAIVPGTKLTLPKQ